MGVKLLSSPRQLKYFPLNQIEYLDLPIYAFVHIKTSWAATTFKTSFCIDAFAIIFTLPFWLIAKRFASRFIFIAFIYVFKTIDLIHYWCTALIWKIVEMPIADWLTYPPPLYINIKFGLSVSTKNHGIWWILVNHSWAIKNSITLKTFSTSTFLSRLWAPCIEMTPAFILCTSTRLFCCGRFSCR